MAGDEEQEDDEENSVDPDAVGVAKMRVSEIKAELDVRGIGYAGIFEKVQQYAANGTCSRLLVPHPCYEPERYARLCQQN